MMNLPESARLLANLVAIRSETWQEAPAARMLVEALPRFGWSGTHLDGTGNVVARRGKGEKELMLMTHIDTVPGGPELLITDEIIRGRGSVDAKAPCCAMAVAGGAVDVPDDWRITLVAAVGEEIDSRGARFRMPRHTPAACVIGEPTGSNGVALSYRGRILFNLQAEDAGAHRSGSPGPMTAVVRAAAEVIDITQKMGEGYSIAVQEMTGREAGARSADMMIDLRTPMGADKDDLEMMLGETAAIHGVRLKIVEYVPPYGVAKSDPVIRAFRNAIRESGVAPRVLAKQGTCDMNVVSPWACSMGAYGPGDSHYDHSPDEQIPVSEFLSGVNVLKLALPRIMSSL